MARAPKFNRSTNKEKNMSKAIITIELNVERGSLAHYKAANAAGQAAANVGETSAVYCTNTEAHHAEFELRGNVVQGKMLTCGVCYANLDLLGKCPDGHVASTVGDCFICGTLLELSAPAYPGELPKWHCTQGCD